MQEESIEKAIEIISENIYNSNINVIDKYELLLNLNHFLRHYEEQTKSKVMKKVKKYE
jgi:hypothetical protein